MFETEHETVNVPSVENVWSTQPVRAVVASRPSSTLQAIATLPVYQPLLPVGDAGTRL